MRNRHHSFGTSAPETVEVKSQIHWRLSSLAPLLVAAAIPGDPVSWHRRTRRHQNQGDQQRTDFSGICAEGKLETIETKLKNMETGTSRTT